MALVQVAKNNGTGSSVTVTLPSATAAGNFLVAFIVDDNASNGTITYPSGWTQDATQAQTFDGFKLFIGRRENCPSGLTSFAFSRSTSGGFSMHVFVAEYSGIATTSPFDQTAGSSSGGSPSASPITSGNMTTTNANDLLLMFGVIDTGGASHALSGATGYTLEDSYNNIGSTSSGWCDQTVAATGTYSPTMAWAGGGSLSWAGLQVSYKLASGGSTLTRSVPTSVVAQTTSTRTVPSSVVATTTSTRSVPTSAVVLQPATRSVPTSVVALQPATRTVPTSAVVQAWATRTIPTSVVASGSLVRSIPTSVVALQVSTRSIPSSLVVLQVQTRTVPTSAVALTSSTRTVPTSVAALVTSTRTIPTSLVVSSSLLVRSVPTSLVVLQSSTRLVPTSVVAATLNVTRTIPTSVVAYITRTRTVPTSAVAQITGARTVPTSAVVKAWSVRVVPTSIVVQLLNIARTVPTSLVVSVPGSVIPGTVSLTTAPVGTVGLTTSSVGTVSITSEEL